MREQILAALAQYGSPALFAAVTIAAIGVPLPITLLLIVTGSLISQGAMNFWWAIGLATAGSVIGDQIGYAVGRWGGSELVDRFTRLLGGPERLEKAQSTARRWGGPGIFFSRWLVTPLGPWVNLASGLAGYPWMRFLIWDTLGEFLGTLLYVSLGKVFSDRVLALDAMLSDLTWAIVALLAAVFLGWKFFSSVWTKQADDGGGA
jgi:membrane protein DedA with SNARE-associated domain